MTELIARAEKFTKEMKSRVVTKTKIQLGDHVTIGFMHTAHWCPKEREAFTGIYYRCIGITPFTLQEERNGKRITLTQKEVDKAINCHYWIGDCYWHIETKNYKTYGTKQV
ncbi:MAG: hypothetical protein WC979_03295 [Candidatus Pacearchaeota archaeon]|jgi:oxalate decarboxylase/phosphoglucose isomerase-like protein (cupin superfamily)|nr:hypothetical protein [Clostridia bacterium]